ncbi:MAG TPA: LuxR C-terminal-related transcriptional regulator [Micrococcaceae bacterium]|nr:LuxR C-terminal-related transcriptional regulator [Micrococcaceae bacterium]
MTPAVDQLKWPVLARNAEIESAKDLLLDDEKLGVVISGEKGVGKSTVANAIVAELGHGYFPLHLRSSFTSSSVPYNCLGFLLARLSAHTAETPTGVLHGVAGLLKSDAAGRDVVIVLDNAAALDEMSTGVIMHLLLTGTAKVIAITQNAGDLPPDFHWLLHDGQLGEVKLERFSLNQTRQVLRGILGHPATATTASALHYASSGNPMLLHALVSEQRRIGNLELRGSVWVLLGPVNHEGGTRVEDLFRARWDNEAPEVRSIIEMLSLAHRVPLGQLAAIFSADVLAEMEDQGTIRVDSGTRRWVTLHESYYGDVVRSWLSLPRRRELFSLLHGPKQPRPGDLSAEDLVSYGSWLLDCGRDLPPETALAAARAAVRLSDPQRALLFAGGISDTDPCWVAAQEQKADAYLSLQEPGRALTALDAVGRERLALLPMLEYARHVAIRCHALRWQSGGPDVLAEISRARKELTRHPAGDDRPNVRTGLRAEDVLDLAEFEYRGFCGEYAQTAERLEAAHANPERSRDYRLRCGSLLVEAWSATGREVDALELADRLAGSLLRPDTEARLADAFASRYATSLLLAGHWRKSIQVLEGLLAGRPARVRCLGGATEAAIGLAYAYAGQVEKALPPLLSAVAELELRPAGNLLGLAQAAAAYAYAQNGKSVQAYDYLGLLADGDGVRSWLSAAAIDFCAAMARHWLGDASAKEWLIGQARLDAEQGRYTSAGINLFGVTAEGGDQELLFMADVAAHRQGPLSELSRLVATGVRTGTAQLLIQACDIAGTLGLEAAEARCAALAQDIAVRVGDTFSAAAARGRAERFTRPLPGRPVVEHPEARLLTEREQQIARLAAKGMSNRDIAAEVGVSVRTIEGHLYQTFTKLGVSSRTDLTGLI